MRLGRAGVINAVNKKNREERTTGSELQERKERPLSGQNIYIRKSDGRKQTLPLHHHADPEAADKIQPGLNSSGDEEEPPAHPSGFERTVANEVRDEEFANEAINLKSQSEEQLVFRKYPWSVWLAGLLFLCCSGYLAYHLTVGRYTGVLIKQLDDKKSKGQNMWWQYLLAVVIAILGFCFIYAGKIDTVLIDRQTGLLEVRRTSIICKTKRE